MKRTNAMICAAAIVAGANQAANAGQAGMAIQPNGQPVIGTDPQPAVQDNPEAKQILQACAQAIARARSITFDATHRATGDMAGYLPAVQSGSVKMLRLPLEGVQPAATDRFTLRVNATETSGKGAVVNLDAAFLRGTSEWLDHAAKTLTEVPEGEARGRILQASKYLRPDEFLKDAPLGDLDKMTAALEGTTSIEGVSCEIVLLSRAAGQGTRWTIGVDDRLPRRIETILPADKGELVLDMKNVVVDNSDAPALTREMMRLALPEGYTESRRKAAAKSPPQPLPVPQGNQGSTKPPDDSSHQATPPPPPEPPKPIMAPEFELAVGRAGVLASNASPGTVMPGVGSKVKLADLRGSVVVLDFFGTWTLAAPAWHVELDALVADLAPRGVRFFALNVREKNPDAAVSYMETESHKPTLLMSATEVAKAYGVRVYPATAVIGKDGLLLELVQGSRADADSKRLVQVAIDKALAESSAPIEVK